MALDGITLGFIKNEISEYLLGAKVEKVYQPSKCELVFLMRTRSGAYRLYMSAQAISPRSGKRFNLTGLIFLRGYT